jgi:hypothetical protein
MTKVIDKAQLRVDIRGKGKTQRLNAFMAIAPLSFVESTSRADTIANMRTALGTSPTEAQMLAARNEWVIGRVASRLPAGALPKSGMDEDARLAFARDVVLFFAAPAKEGAKARKLRAHQKGRRSAMQHKVARAAEEAWSQVKAELGIGTAQTQRERAVKKRAAQAAGSTKRGKASTETLTQLATPAKPLNADEAVNHVVTQSAALLGFSNKYAKLLPLGFGEAVQAFKTAVNKAANDYQVSKA